MKNQVINDERAEEIFQEFLDEFELDRLDDSKEAFNKKILKAIKLGRLDFDLENFKATFTLKKKIGDKTQVVLSLDNVTTGKAQDVSKVIEKDGNYNSLIELISCGSFANHEILQAKPTDVGTLAGLSLYFLAS